MVRHRLVHLLGTVPRIHCLLCAQRHLERPPAFPQEAYESLIYPDMFFIPLYLLTATMLYRRHWLGSVSAFVAGGGIIYVMIYLLALGFSGIDNVIMDGIFLVCTLVSLWQVSSRANRSGPS